MRVSDEYEFIQLLGVTPRESSRPAEGFWVYQVDVSAGTKLRFSFSASAGSVQTDILLGETVIHSVSSEGAQAIKCDHERRAIVATFGSDGSWRSELTIELGGETPIVRWGLLTDE